MGCFILGREGCNLLLKYGAKKSRPGSGEIYEIMPECPVL